MYYIYVLKSLNLNHYYTGFTDDLENRLLEHKSGKTKSLKTLLPIKLAFCQKFDDLKSARKIEYKLKRLKSRKIIEKIIESKYISMKV